MSNREGPNHFDTVTSKEKIDSWQEYLNWQAKLFFKSEVSFLERLGLPSESGSILDLGCGPGLYVERLAKAYPDRQFIACDANQALIDEFKNRLQTSEVKNIEILRWRAGEDFFPGELNECSTVILRYVAQHQARAGWFLSKIKKAFPKNTHFYLIEEDDNLYSIEPRLTPLEKLLGYYDEWARSIGSHRDMGRQLPRLLVDAGFKVDRVEVNCHSAMANGVEDFLQYFRTSIDVLQSTVPGLINDEDAAAMKRGFDLYSSNYQNGCLLFYPQVIAKAVSI